MARFSGSARRGGDRDTFFGMVPLRSVVLFFAAVFLVFAPVSQLIASSLRPERTMGSFLLMAFLSGMLAVSWAATYTISRGFLAGVVLSVVAMIASFGPLRNTWFGTPSRTPSLEGVATVLMIAAGYTLFVIFISGQGRTTMRLQTEMALARTIHESLVPAVDLATSRFEAFGVSTASTEMGGDLIDVIEHGAGIDLVVADVSGHGVRAGVVMGMLKSALRTRLLSPGTLGETLASLNVVLEQLTRPEMYATFAGVRIPAGGGAVEYALAGHHHLVCYRGKDGEVVRLDGRNPPLGMLARAEYAVHCVEVAGGDLLAIYTDGLNETADPADQQLGHEPIERTIRDHGARPLREIHDAVVGLVRSHGAQSDDRTLLLVRFR